MAQLEDSHVLKVLTVELCHAVNGGVALLHQSGVVALEAEKFEPLFQRVLKSKGF